VVVNAEIFFFRPLLADQDFGCLHAGNGPPVSSKRLRQAARAS
jgi:hypothetical protein